ncbi:MAG: helix-hairpin-helix domain-containing protein [Comamonadaceae bacterium]|jgi:competence protein ComEA|uniref:ComEA family DNA-binding protein n=1 Tax=Hydrogenophaga sp. SNF1 TaxID=3098762 RepID=UPI002ACBF9B0|nr:helix-hairpin-helix domain-containing protein [Hydrogenophaga sp. SNF1]NCT96846.1 helix-hairpin-helix domain-containing protein [Comamonadaceae bacterium]WQB84534.1 helix-hairpin-helix domain-containing protein [Hydrogenophaga sp. SNF1]
MKKLLVAALLALSAATSFAAVDVNKASQADLDSIKGIGPSTTGKILEQRKAAPFKNWNDFIARVPGIGDKRAAKLSHQGLTVNGEAFKATSAPAGAKPKQ